MSTRPTTRYRLAAVAFLAPLLLPGAAHGAVFTVNVLFDGGDANPGDCICAAMGAPVCTLRAAVQEANYCQGGPHDIELGPGNHTLSLPGYGPEKGDLDVLATAIIHGAGSNVTEISAGPLSASGNPDRIFDVWSGGDLFTENLTLSNATHAENGGLVRNAGNFTAWAVEMYKGASTANRGGAVYNSGFALLEDCYIHENSAYDRGGALYNSGTMTVRLSDIQDNGLSSSASWGGGAAQQHHCHRRHFLRQHVRELGRGRRSPVQPGVDVA